MAPLLVYWDARGIAEPIRFLLRYAGVEFEDRRYEVITPQKHMHDRTNWEKDKDTLDLLFPNLPYYIDGQVKLTQSLAILRYLARKYKLDGSTEEERQLIDVLEQEARDMRASLRVAIMNPAFENHKGEYLKNVQKKLKQLEAVLQDKKWFVGDGVTYVDFLMYDILDYHILLESTCLDMFPGLKNFVDRVENLPNIKKYMESVNYKRWPIFAPYLYWGYYK